MIVKTFTDIYGEIHNDAVIVVTSAYSNCNGNSTYEVPSSDEGFYDGEPIETSYSQNSLRFSCVYWDNQESFDAGEIPKILLSNKYYALAHDNTLTEISGKSFPEMQFVDVNELTPEYVDLSAVTQAEKFINEHV